MSVCRLSSPTYSFFFIVLACAYYMREHLIGRFSFIKSFDIIYESFLTLEKRVRFVALEYVGDNFRLYG